ncbi:chromo domain protein [Gregarina niphandrodes]|uniref:Chromo domain protein n=1 Tax=Gregarina niphandrodes TaxID=110365 RepID=A0A023B7K2_GRENI|nr:chromo domain protein [Gregarina niphandrodes]EZG67361.1 chromo domain protein [Gregarina niphandrodes]|eukprot:XP_011130262.1 chromo domain protein [Gregarina niphandrodes]
MAARTKIYVIDFVCGYKRVEDTNYFRIKWEGWPMTAATWEPLKHILDPSADILQQMANSKRAWEDMMERGLHTDEVLLDLPARRGRDSLSGSEGPGSEQLGAERPVSDHEPELHASRVPAWRHDRTWEGRRAAYDCSSVDDGVEIRIPVTRDLYDQDYRQEMLDGSRATPTAVAQDRLRRPEASLRASGYSALPVFEKAAFDATPANKKRRLLYLSDAEQCDTAETEMETEAGTDVGSPGDEDWSPLSHASGTPRWATPPSGLSPRRLAQTGQNLPARRSAVQGRGQVPPSLRVAGQERPWHDDISWHSRSDVGPRYAGAGSLRPASTHMSDSIEAMTEQIAKQLAKNQLLKSRPGTRLGHEDVAPNAFNAALIQQLLHIRNRERQSRPYVDPRTTIRPRICFSPPEAPRFETRAAPEAAPKAAPKPAPKAAPERAAPKKAAPKTGGRRAASKSKVGTASSRTRQATSLPPAMDEAWSTESNLDSSYPDNNSYLDGSWQRTDAVRAETIRPDKVVVDIGDDEVVANGDMAAEVIAVESGGTPSESLERVVIRLTSIPETSPGGLEKCVNRPQDPAPPFPPEEGTPRPASSGSGDADVASSGAGCADTLSEGFDKQKRLAEGFENTADVSDSISAATAWEERAREPPQQEPPQQENEHSGLCASPDQRSAKVRDPLVEDNRGLHEGPIGQQPLDQEPPTVSAWSELVGDNTLSESTLDPISSTLSPALAKEASPSVELLGERQAPSLVHDEPRQAASETSALDSEEEPRRQSSLSQLVQNLMGTRKGTQRHSPEPKCEIVQLKLSELGEVMAKYLLDGTVFVEPLKKVRYNYPQAVIDYYNGNALYNLPS